MEQALYITAIVLFALGWAAVAAGALLFWRGGRRAALIPLLTGAAVIVVSAACLLSGLVSGPWAQRVEVREESGETVVSLRPKLLPQSALGPEMDRVRQEIVTQYENWEPISRASTCGTTPSWPAAPTLPRGRATGCPPGAWSSMGRTTGRSPLSA